METRACGVLFTTSKEILDVTVSKLYVFCSLKIKILFFEKILTKSKPIVMLTPTL